MDIKNVVSSAIGTASHTPVTPMCFGRTSKAVHINANVLSTEIIADTLPLDRAVNSDEANILKPQNKKLNEKIEKPRRAIWYTAVPSGEKIETSDGPKKIAAMKTATEAAQIRYRQFFIILLSVAGSPRPKL